MILYYIIAESSNGHFLDSCNTQTCKTVLNCISKSYFFCIFNVLWSNIFTIVILGSNIGCFEKYQDSVVPCCKLYCITLSNKPQALLMPSSWYLHLLYAVSIDCTVLPSFCQFVLSFLLFRGHISHFLPASEDWWHSLFKCTMIKAN